MHDVLVWIVILFCFALTAGVMYYFAVTLNTQFQADTGLTASVKADYQDYTTRYPKIWDSLFMFVFFGLLILMIASAWLIDAHPIFLPILIALMLVVIFVGMIFGNMFYDLGTNSPLGSYFSQMTMTTFVFEHNVLISIICLSLTLLVLFGKPRIQQ